MAVVLHEKAVGVDDRRNALVRLTATAWVTYSVRPLIAWASSMNGTKGQERLGPVRQDRGAGLAQARAVARREGRPAAGH